MVGGGEGIPQSSRRQHTGGGGGGRSYLSPIEVSTLGGLGHTSVQ